MDWLHVGILLDIGSNSIDPDGQVLEYRRMDKNMYAAYCFLIKWTKSLDDLEW